MTSMFFELSSADIQLKFKAVPIDEISASEGVSSAAARLFRRRLSSETPSSANVLNVDQAEP